MKKFMCVAMAMFMSITSAYAAELNVVYNPNTGLYDVSGNASEAEYNDFVSVTVIKDDVIGWASTLKMDENGDFKDSFAFTPAAEGGYYTVSVGVYDKGVVETDLILHITIEQKQEALKAINGAEDTEALNKAILDNALYIGLDEELYNSLGTAKKDVLDTLLNKASYTSIDDFLIEFDTACAYALIKNADKESIIQIIDKYALYFNLSSSELYEEFLGLDKHEVYIKMAGADCKSKEDVLGAFESSVVLTLINNTTKWNDFKTVLDTYIGYLDIDTDYYDKCDKSELASAICDEEYNLVEDLYNAIKKYYNGLKKDSGNSSGGGSGSKGKGGGAVSYTNPLSQKDNKAENDEAYTDMAGFEWAAEAVNALTKRGVLSGDGTGKFNPADNVTREQFVKMLILAFDMYSAGEKSEFIDVDANNWAYPYISCAFSKGIVNGISVDTFGYGMPVTRQDMAVLISRVKQFNDELESINIAEFKDMEEISDYAKSGVFAMMQAGIINGYNDGCFRPKNLATRAEAAMMLYRALSK